MTPNPPSPDALIEKLEALRKPGAIHPYFGDLNIGESMVLTTVIDIIRQHTRATPKPDALIEKLEIYKQQHNRGDMPMDAANFYVNGCIEIIRQHTADRYTDRYTDRSNPGSDYTCAEVERVARAIFLQSALTADSCERIAKAAIAAMGEPNGVKENKDSSLPGKSPVLPNAQAIEISVINTLENAQLFEQEAITPYEKVLARSLVAALRKHKPVSVSLEKCADAAQQAMRYTDSWQCDDMRDIAKAILNTAGVAYAD